MKYLISVRFDEFFLLIKQFYLRFDGKKLISIPISGNGNNFRDDAFLFFLLQS